MAEPLLNANSEYIQQLYELYRQDPQRVDPQWRAFFQGMEFGGGAEPRAAGSAAQIPVQDLVHSFRELGHFVANLDPLGRQRPNHPLLDLGNFKITAEDLDRQVEDGTFLGKTDGTLRDLIDKLLITYTQTLGVEFMTISDKNQRQWLIQRMEPALNKPNFSPEQKIWIYKQLCKAQGLEEYLKLKFATTKRFGLEGGEAFIPLLNTFVEEGAELGVEEIVMGMAHRGRINTLAHVLGKPYETVLSEFEGHFAADFDQGDGDVKYHLGFATDRTTATGKKIHLALAFNPSHLELVNPVVEGIVRAKQYRYGDNTRNRVVPLLVHGDASFTGQGIVLETLALSEMPYWRTGGTVHILINNQIGFTTLPKQGRFTPYPTDVAKTIQAPIFHVNGDDPEACVFAAKLAIAFRQQYHCDVFIDLWCYRKHGHNEVDEPAFTQPQMYRDIEKKTPIREIYRKRLEQEGVLKEGDGDRYIDEVKKELDEALANAKANLPKPAEAFPGLWRGFSRAPADPDKWETETAITPRMAKQISEGLSHVPADFTPHPKLKKLLENRGLMGEGQLPFDFGTGEAMALGSLMLEGIAIRFVGQDAQRGTFSHRHACLHDYNSGKKYYPLANIHPDQAPIAIVNTMLSELAVLGFEYGFSAADPKNLVVWEAQFGDFVNGAQAIVDQFIVAAESKWQKYTGLVMLLPHGYEGQGPEHSYGYLDRFLSLCAENNIQVIQPSTPAQYFHALRRQMLRKFRKPLISMMPKSLLRSEAAGSALAEFTEGSFKKVMDDPRATEPSAIRRLLLCTGKVYYTLDKARRETGGKPETAIVRVEQLYPFPERQIKEIFRKYDQAIEVGWVQEEPRNRGGWVFMDQMLRPMLPDRVLKYFGREIAASPAKGNYRFHVQEEKELVAAALNLQEDELAAISGKKDGH